MKHLKLNQLSEEQLKQTKAGKGTIIFRCGCGCCYADKGGSSIDANGQANHASYKTSTACELVYWTEASILIE